MFSQRRTGITGPAFHIFISGPGKEDKLSRRFPQSADKANLTPEVLLAQYQRSDRRHKAIVRATGP